MIILVQEPSSTPQLYYYFFNGQHCLKNTWKKFKLAQYGDIVLLNSLSWQQDDVEECKIRETMLFREQAKMLQLIVEYSVT